MTVWETVIGLEVHVQLATRSKLFCGCSSAFGDEPNRNICPVCLGLPGALPVPNSAAVRLGARAALALGCTVHPVSVFARKNYFYPDLPKGYQISQFDRPLATGGEVRCVSPDRGVVTIGVTRLHLEEDAGKLLHDRIPGHTAIDLNRAGVPLAEIVSEPDLRSPAEARAYLTILKQVLTYAGVSDCSMEKGSLRVDANISLRRPGDPRLGTRTELKNMNSFASVERALEIERNRQGAVLDEGGRVEQVTLLFNPDSGTVRTMRSKEESHDYRYCPDPDLPPVVVSIDWIEATRAELPELPETKQARLASSYGLSAYDTGVLAAERTVADYFESVVAAGADPKAAANWVMGESMPGYHDAGQFVVSADRLAALIDLIKDGTVSHQAAKRVFGELGAGPEAPRAVAERLGVRQVRDDGQLRIWVEQVITDQPTEVERYRAGELKLLGFLVGQVMKKSRGKADPNAVSELLLTTIEGS